MKLLHIEALCWYTCGQLSSNQHWQWFATGLRLFTDPASIEPLMKMLGIEPKTFTCLVCP